MAISLGIYPILRQTQMDFEVDHQSNMKQWKIPFFFGVVFVHSPKKWVMFLDESEAQQKKTPRHQPSIAPGPVGAAFISAMSCGHCKGLPG